MSHRQMSTVAGVFALLFKPCIWQSGLYVLIRISNNTRCFTDFIDLFVFDIMQPNAFIGLADKEKMKKSQEQNSFISDVLSLFLNLIL